MRTSRAFVVAILLIAFGVAACGSSGSKGATASPGSTTAPGSPGATPTTKKISGNSGSNFCDLARNESKAFSPDISGGSTPADLRAEFANILPALQHIEDIAPSALKGDFATFLDAYKPFIQALADANYDFTKIDLTAASNLGSADVKAATDHIDQYLTQVCHITTPTT